MKASRVGLNFELQQSISGSRECSQQKAPIPRWPLRASPGTLKSTSDSLGSSQQPLEVPRRSQMPKSFVPVQRNAMPIALARAPALFSAVVHSSGLRPLPPTPRKRCRRNVARDAPQTGLKAAWRPVLASESAVGDLSGPLKVLPRSLPVPPWPLKVLPRSRPVPPCHF